MCEYQASNMEAASSQLDRADPEPTLRDIFAAVTTCSPFIADLTGGEGHES